VLNLSFEILFWKTEPRKVTIFEDLIDKVS